MAEIISLVKNKRRMPESTTPEIIAIKK